jgi:hypothetical protein
MGTVDVGACANEERGAADEGEARDDDRRGATTKPHGISLV